MFAWDAYEHGTDIHPQAEPTALTLMHREFNTNKDEFKQDLQQSILDKYGGEEHLDAPAKELLLAQTVSRERETERQRERGRERGRLRQRQRQRQRQIDRVCSEMFYLTGRVRRIFSFGKCNKRTRESYC